MLLTISTIAQLPNALTLGGSFELHHPGELFVIGLADDPDHLPAGFQCAYPVLLATDCLGPEVALLSTQYTPTEFVAASKPSFIRAALDTFTSESYLLYADPETFIYQPLTPIYEQLQSASALITPHITQAPNDSARPDEKALQNIGLYSSGFLAFSRTTETNRLVAWWQDRVTSRAFINPCEGLCADQLWLMHWPIFFEGVRVVKNPGWQVALWNLPERQLHLTNAGWRVGKEVPLLFINFRGLTNPDAGFFPNQTRLPLANRADVQTLVADYQRSLLVFDQWGLRTRVPAFGQQPEPVILRGWQQTLATALRHVIRFIDSVPIPVFR